MAVATKHDAMRPDLSSSEANTPNAAVTLALRNCHANIQAAIGTDAPQWRLRDWFELRSAVSDYTAHARQAGALPEAIVVELKMMVGETLPWPTECIDLLDAVVTFSINAYYE